MLRVVIADPAQARFYDVDRAHAPLRLVGHLRNPASTASPADHPRRHEVLGFANRITNELEAARLERRFDRLVVIAAPHFVSMLHSLMSPSMIGLIEVEVLKDLVHAPESDVLTYLPEQVLSGDAARPA